MIRRYGILNDSIEPGDVFLYGIPYPGVYMCDEEGVVISKSFHDTYKKRDSADLLLDAALGRVVVNENAPQAEGGKSPILYLRDIQPNAPTAHIGCHIHQPPPSSAIRRECMKDKPPALCGHRD